MDHRAIVLFDRAYCAWHRLDAPAARIPPLLLLGTERAWRTHRLPDGTKLLRGHRYGELHLDNARVIALRERGLPFVQLGLEFRRRLIASLSALAAAAHEGGRLEELEAFSAITIFHRGLARLGFAVEPHGLLASRVTGAYQHALLRTLAARPGRHRPPLAKRLWISRGRLVALYGRAPRPDAIGPARR